MADSSFINQSGDMKVLTAEACAISRTGDFSLFSDWMGQHDLKMQTQLLMYWSVLTVSLRKASDPVEEGLVMDASDRSALSGLCEHFGAAMAPAQPAGAFVYLDMAAGYSWDRMAATVQNLMRFGWHIALMQRAWILIQVLQTLREGSESHSIFITRAAMLRMMAYSALVALRKHQWCSDDLTAIFEVSRHLDDRKPFTPMDDRH